MIPAAVRPLRDLIKEHGENLAFGDLAEPMLEDLAVGWAEGRPIAVAAAELLSQIDDIPFRRRDRQIAGRALLALLARQGAPIEVEAPAEHVYLLGRRENDTGDPEAEAAWERREAEYRSLSEHDVEYPMDMFKIDVATAFNAARQAMDANVELPEDKIASEHRLALLYRNAPQTLRAWFHRRYKDTDPDVVCWKFILAGRALARYRTEVLPGETPAGSIPKQLMDSVLAIDLGDLARTSILEPVG